MIRVGDIVSRSRSSERAKWAQKASELAKFATELEEMIEEQRAKNLGKR
jgi:hypothetical protein